MKILNNMLFLIILCMILLSCYKPPSNVVLENGMYTVVKLDSTNYLVSPTTSNSTVHPFILKTK